MESQRYHNLYSMFGGSDSNTKQNNSNNKSYSPPDKQSEFSGLIEENRKLHSKIERLEKELRQLKEKLKE